MVQLKKETSPCVPKLKPKNPLKNIFHRSSRSSSVTSGSSPSNLFSNSFDLKEDDDLSSEDEGNFLNTYNAANDPLCFKSQLLTTLKKSLHGTDPLNTSNNLLDLLDEDYTKYLKQPKYIRTFKKSITTSDVCKRLFLAQELNQKSEDGDLGGFAHDVGDLNLDPHNGFDADSIKTDFSHGLENSHKNSIWAMKFSNDGKYLATAGKSAAINIWKVISSPLDRLTPNDPTQLMTTKEGKVMYASVFQPSPHKVYTGHNHDILSLDWSKNNFILSSSMDKTVKLWNIKKDQALRTFPHGDFVTSAKFHPTDDRFFVSGCLDHKVRLWSIIDNEVSFEFDAKDLVTAVGFTPNGNLTIVGTFNGIVYFLDTLTLELRHSVQLKKKRSDLGAKITGIETFVEGDDIKIVITSNDSKIRLLSLRHRQLVYYYKGLENQQSQIMATVSDDHKYIISGSENHWVYVWDVDRPVANSHHHHPFEKLVSNKKKRGDYTSFHAHHSVVTCAAIAPAGTAKALSLSNDFIYELNTEVEKKEYSENGGVSDKYTALFNKDFIGSIIVTADDEGVIRIFRQDFPSHVRKSLLDNRGKKRKNSMGTNPNDSIVSSQGGTTVVSGGVPGKEDSMHKFYINKSHNASATSLLNRGYSLRKSITEGEEKRGRSRNGTIDSNSEPSTTVTGDTSLPVTCDVCGGDKFSVMKQLGDTGSEHSDIQNNRAKRLGVFCTDCGNQINA